ncbi:MAG: PQQ-binding-like beta-propeller repeat protein [Sandaracinaceae bacterium]|nr:PQQ-binding-like beta-propeller repeat protein [Sandaracinaceae bacterium]
MGPLDGAVDVGPSDTTPPRGDITFPMMDAFTQAAETLVRGTASDEVGVVSVTVNGVVADTDDDFATWSANVALGDRDTEVRVVISDAAGGRTTLSRSITRFFPFEAPYGAHLDTANDRFVYVSNDAVVGPRLMAADIGAQDVRVLTSLAAFGEGADRPVALAYDSMRDRWVFGARVAGAMGSRGLYTFRESTGFAPLSNTTTHPAAAVIENAVYIEYDPTQDVLYVIDGASASIVAVDADSGDRTVLSSPTVPNASAPLLGVPTAARVSADGSTLYVVDRTGGLMAIDTSSGARTPISDSTLGSGPALTTTMGLALDEANDRAFVYDAALSRAIVEVDLSSGDRSVLADNTGGEPSLRDARALFYDPFREAVVLGADVSNALLAVSTVDGERTTLLRSGFPRTFEPTQPRDALALGDALYVAVANPGFTGILRIGSDGARTEHIDLAGRVVTLLEPVPGQRALFGLNQDTNGAIYRLDLDARTVSVVRDGTSPGIATPGYAGLAPLSADDVLVLSDDSATVGRPVIVARVDVSSGRATLLSGPTTPDTNLPLMSVFTLAVDAERDRALVGAFGPSALFAVDLGSGARSLFAEAPASGPLVGQLSGPVLMDGRIFAILDGRDVVALHPTTGARTLVAANVSPARWLNTLHVDGDRLIAVEGGGNVLQVEPESGAVLSLHR